MVAIVVGIYGRVGGVWERCNGPAPETGFVGPFGRVSGVWQGIDYAAHRGASVWTPVWVNIDGELSLSDKGEFDGDYIGPPWYASVTFDFTYTGSSWRPYDCGRDYEVKFTETDGSWTDHPTLNTWLDLTDPDTSYDMTKTRTSQGQGQAEMTIYVREKINAAPSGNDFGVWTATVEAGLL